MEQNSFTSFRRFLLALGLVCLFALGCAAGDGNDENNDNSDNSGTSDFFVIDKNIDSGRAEAEFSLPEGTTKFSVSAELEGSGSIRFEVVEDEEGRDYLSPGGAMLSFGEEFLPTINSVSVPSRDADGEIDSSLRFHVRVSSSGAAAGDVVHFIVNSRPDGNFSGGTLNVNIFYVGDIGQDSSSKNAVGAAVDEFRRIYGAAGIGLNIASRDIDGPALVPDPFNGGGIYQSASSLTQSPSVNVFVAGDVEGEEGTLLGISGGLPGPPVPSPRSAVVVSIVTGAGRDGAYDDEEIRLLGESMAHEVGHFLGLFHPVDFSGDSVEAEDPLSDTASCDNEVDCNQNSSLISNVMYPTPVFKGSSLIPQNGLTGQQKGVLNRYVAVD